VRPLGRPEIRRDPRELPRCSLCAVASPSPTSRLYACLSCAAVFCPSHAATHASASAGTGHQIAVDRAACGDQAYNPDFDHAIFLAQSSSLLPSTSTYSAFASPALRKRWRVDYRAWLRTSSITDAEWGGDWTTTVGGRFLGVAVVAFAVKMGACARRGRRGQEMVYIIALIVSRDLFMIQNHIFPSKGSQRWKITR
jgi:hypothetical protein